MKILIGSGGLAKDFLSYFKYLYVFLIDDCKTGQVFGHPIIGSISDFLDDSDKMLRPLKHGNFGITPTVFNCVGSVGYNGTRNKVFDRLCEAGIETDNIIMGSFIASDVSLGKNILINVGVQIHHDVIIEDNCVISPSVTICGDCHICKNSFIGAGSTIIQGITLGENCIIAAGSVVTTNVPPNSVYGGCPAKNLNRKD